MRLPLYLFEYGPAARFRHLAGFGPDLPLSASSKARIVFLIGWLPLLILSCLQDITEGSGAFRSFFADAKLHANFLIAGPVLAFADGIVGRRLTDIVHHFDRDGIVRERHRLRFRQMVESAKNALTRPGITLTIVIAAYAVALATVFSFDLGDLSPWHLDMDRQTLAPAGWWHVLVSLPIFVVLVFGWLWRLIVWGWLLAQTSRLDLSIQPAHPDLAGGLGFVGYSLRALAPVGFAIGVVGAGSLADAILRQTASLFASGIFAASLTAGALLVCSLPVLTFLPRLMAEWWRGVFTYDTLAIRQATRFEERWITRNRGDRDILQAPDFSASADLFQVVANVHSLRPVPIDLRSAIFFVIATLLPFIPVLLLTIPPDRMLESLQSLLL